MKILTISGAAWDDTNSVGNTYSNFFSCLKEAEVSNVFTRDAAPNNSVCKKYFRISDKMLLKNVFAPAKIGKGFYFDYPQNKKAQSDEKKMIAAIHKHNFKFMYTAQNILWRFGGWKNKKFKSFLDENKPDIIFTFAIPSVQRYLLLKFIKEYTGARVVLHIADNVYGEILSGRKSKRSAKAKRFREMIAWADKLYGCSEEICSVYGEEFSRDIEPLYKGCSFEDNLKAKINSPVKIVYAGNLLFGREKTLSVLSEAIAEINAQSKKFFLEIYSGTPIDENLRKKLDVEGASAFCGAKPYEEIKEILSKADMVLHVESFEENQIESVRYSFSTKITDCLQSGGLLTVIGPKGISSVEYPRKIEGAMVIDNLADIKSSLQALKVEEIPARSASIRGFAQNNHSVYSLKEKLQKVFIP